MSRPVPTPPRVCEHCQQTYERRPDQEAYKFNRQRFCGNSCASAWKFANGVGIAKTCGNVDNLRSRWERARERRAALLEDLEWIIDTDHPERVAQRLGYDHPEYLIRSLHRWGRVDLANRLERAS